MKGSSRTPCERPDIPEMLNKLAEGITKDMEAVRVHACTVGNGIAELWVMDTLHDLRQEIYRIRILTQNTTRPV